MKRNVLASSTALLTSLLLGGPKTGWAAAAPNQQKMMEAYDRLPFGFEANQGQTDERVQFFARGSGYRLFLLRDEAVFVQEKPLDAQLRASASSGQTERATLIHMRFSGASATPQITGFAPLPGKSNYFLGNDPKRWRINVPNYAQVKYAEVYPGIDVVYHGTRGQLQYDFVVRPGADPNTIRLKFESSFKVPVRIDGNGDLVLAAAGGDWSLHKPIVYQTGAAGQKQFVAAEYVRKGNQEVQFKIAAYDVSRPLVIDPTLVYSTYLGGNNNDQANGLAIDALGDAYVTGFTISPNFPVSTDAFQGTIEGFEAVFVSKLNAAFNRFQLNVHCNFVRYFAYIHIERGLILDPRF